MKKRKRAHRLSEKAVQNVLEEHFREQGWGVKREVETPVGYIDILLWKPRSNGSIEKILIEVKERGGLKGAVGQVQMYSLHEECDRRVIIYFSYDGKDRGIDSKFYGLEGIEIESVHRYIDINRLIQEEERICQKKERVGISENTLRIPRPIENIREGKQVKRRKLNQLSISNQLTEELRLSESKLMTDSVLESEQIQEELERLESMKEIEFHGISLENIMW